MIFNQTDHILANGSFTIPDGSDSITIRIPAFERTPPSLVLTPIGPNANVNLFVDDTSSTYSPISYDLTEAFETKNGSYKYTAPAESWSSNGSNSYPEGGLQAWWRLTDKNIGDDGVAIDSGPNSRNGSQATIASRPTNSPTLYPSVYIQKSSCTFDGTTSYLKLGGGGLWNGLIGNVGGTSKMTFSAWIHPSISAGGVRTILSFGGTGGTIWYIDGAAIRFRTSWNNGVALWTAVSEVTYGEWNHVAVTYDANHITNEAYYYINGVFKPAFSYPAARIAPWIGVVNTKNYIGSYAAGMWWGELADVAVWNKILSAEDIKAIYDASVTGVVDDGVDGHALTIKRSSDVGALTVQWQAIAADPVRTKV